MRVLAHHDRRRQKSQGNPNSHDEASASKSVPSDQATGTRATRSLRDRLKPVYHEKDAELVLNLVDCRKKLNFKETADASSEPPTKRARRDEIPCFAYVAIWDNREGYQSQDPLVKASRKCVLQPYESPLGAPAIHITMDEPFRLQARELFVPVKHQGSEVMMIGDKYIMEIKIIPTSSTELWPPIPILNKSEGSLNPDGSRRVFGSMQGCLVSNYLNLPFAPADDVPLSVAFDQGGRTYKTKYGFEVSSHWEAPRSPLEQSIKKEEKEEESPVWYHRTPAENGISKPKRKAKTVRKPTAATLSQRTVPMNDTVHVKPKTTIYYIYEPLLPRIEGLLPGFKSCRVEGHWCPTCRTEFITLRQLHFHLTSNHPKFNFFVDKEEKPDDSNMPARVTIRVEEAEIFRERASNDVLDPREMLWISPNKPLNVDAYLSGDSRWLGGPYRKKKVPKPPSEKVKKIWELPKFRHPTDVPDLPDRPLSRNAVPHAKTVHETPFYRSISHKVVDLGEALSETDDEIDQSWLKQKHRSKLAEHRTEWFENDVQRRLRIAFDEHLMDERFPSTRYVSDAFVRFLRKLDNEEWLWKDQGPVEIINICCEMMKDGVMNDSVFLGITDFMNQRPERRRRMAEASPCIEDSLLSNMSDVDPGNRAVQRPNTISESPSALGTQRPKIPPEGSTIDPDIHGICGICYRMITRRKKAIACSRGGECLHGWRTYHLGCGGLTVTSKDWICPPCMEQATAEKRRNEAAQQATDSVRGSPMSHRQDQSHPVSLREPLLFHQANANRFDSLRERTSFTPASKNPWLTVLPRGSSPSFIQSRGQESNRPNDSTLRRSTKTPPLWNDNSLPISNGQHRNDGRNSPLMSKTTPTKDSHQAPSPSKLNGTFPLSPIRSNTQPSVKSQLISTPETTGSKILSPANFVDLTQDDPPSPSPRSSISLPHRKVPATIRQNDEYEDDDLIELPATSARPKTNLHGINGNHTPSSHPNTPSHTFNRFSAQRSNPRSSNVQDQSQHRPISQSKPPPEIITLDGGVSPSPSPTPKSAALPNGTNEPEEQSRPWEGRIFSMSQLLTRHNHMAVPPPPSRRRRSGRV